MDHSVNDSEVKIKDATSPTMRGVFVRKKESWTTFSGKAVVVLGVLVLLGMFIGARYRIVGDPQTIRCIPGYTVYLVDLQDRELVRGKLYMFRSKNLAPIYAEGTKMLKYLRGMPGDFIEVRSNDQVFINGVASEAGLSLAEEKLGRPASSFHGKATLGADDYWFLGTSPLSFDSRYWGAVKRESIVGRAYPIF